jgi:hypothetical protein
LSASLELEIKHLLSQEDSLDQVIEKVILTVETSGEFFSVDEVSTLCRFLLHAGAHQSLNQFIFRHWNENEFTIPWHYWLNSLEERITPELGALLLEGITGSKGENDACQSSALHQLAPELKKLKELHKHQALENYDKQKFQLLADLATLRFQQLFERERQLLARLLKMYPGDQDILKESSDFNERNAFDVISRRAPNHRPAPWDSENRDASLDQAKQSWSRCLLEAAKATPENDYDLSVAAFMMGLFETSLQILALTGDRPGKIWFQMEALLQARRFLEVLQALPDLEMQQVNDPETFFATAYLRAQALWGMGQKHSAIEVMESILSARPGYRLGQTLLTQWRGR